MKVPFSIWILAGLLAGLGARSLADSHSPKPIPVSLRGANLALQPPALWDGREVYLPLDALKHLNMDYRWGAKMETVFLTIENGPAREVAVARPGRDPMVGLSDVLVNKRRFSVTGSVCSIDPPAPTPAAPKSDLSSHKLVSTQTSTTIPQIPASLGSGSPAKKPTSPDSVTRVQSPHSVDDTPPASNPPAVPSASKPVKDDPSNNQIDLDLPPIGSPEALPFAGFKVLRGNSAILVDDVQIEPMGESTIKIRIHTTGKPAVSARYLRQPTRVALDFDNASVERERSDVSVNHPLVSHVHVIAGEKPGTSRVEIDLSKMAGYRLDDPDADGVTVTLLTPKGSGRKLQSMVVVVDPGHGGNSSPGASVKVNGEIVYERDLTLSIARKLHRMLTEAGVDAVLTRNDNRDVSLESRPTLANEADADAFISLHIDDCPKPNTASGSTAYYHMGDIHSRALAQTMVERVGQVSGLPVRGARSDATRFRTGMAVLRMSKMPATLVELGYINNDTDRAKLMDSAYQMRIARALFDGVKSYALGTLPDNP